MAQDALDTRETVSIKCNCGQKAHYDTAAKTNVCVCEHCGTVIGLLGVSGGPGAVLMRKDDGTEQGFPVQGFDD